MTRSALLALALLLLGPATTLANGGRLRVAEAPIGDYRVTVFTSPTPVPPDTLDVSVLVMEVSRSEPVEGLEVRVALKPIGHTAPPQSQRATKEAANDPRYYAAEFRLGGAGRWDVGVRVTGPGGEGEVTFQIEAAEWGPLDNPLVVLVLSLLPLALLAWWLLRRRPPHPDLETTGTDSSSSETSVRRTRDPGEE